MTVTDRAGLPERRSGWLVSVLAAVAIVLLAFLWSLVAPAVEEAFDAGEPPAAAASTSFGTDSPVPPAAVSR